MDTLESGSSVPVPGAPRPGLLLVISAPSGGGKTTVLQGLLARDAARTRVVTCTTRAPRGGERDGVDYHFLSPGSFEAQVEAGAFLEHAVVYGNRYGTRKEDVLALVRAGREVLLSVDVQGVASIQALAAVDVELASALVTVFLMPPTVEELEGRLKGRGEDDAAVVARRLAVAREEMACWPGFDYLVVSGTREADLARVEAILAAERCRSRRLGGVWRSP